MYRRTTKDFAQGEELLRRSLNADENFVPALCALSQAHVARVLFGVTDDPNRQRQEAMHLARRAIDLDRRDPLALCAMARAHLASREHDKAVPFLNSALVLNPTLAWAHYLLGVCYTYTGRTSEALPHLHAAIQLSPHDPYASRCLTCVAEAHFFLEEDEQAVEWAKRGLRETATAHWSAHTVLVAALTRSGRVAEANEAVRELLVLRPDFSLSVMARSTSLTRADYLARYFQALREAGVPE